MQLEASGWKGQNGTAMKSSASTAAFFRDIVREGFRRGRVLGLQLRAGDRPVAQRVSFVEAPGAMQKVLHNYIGSVATDRSGGVVAASAPKGGQVTYWDVAARRYLGACDLRDGCGLAPTHRSARFLLTSGEGWLVTAGPNAPAARLVSRFQWDNHAVLVR